MASREAHRQLDAVDGGWRRFRAAVERLGPDELERVTPAGWTAKEMLAHIAFWEETVTPVIVGRLRGGPDDAFEGWYGGDELGLTRNGPWPVSEVHNAREAAWARSRGATDVLARLDRAHRRLVELVTSLSEREWNDHRYSDKIANATWRHYAEHLPELEAIARDASM